ncbi:hypothetical protein A0H81_04455 [Grifola frondosa]|uniref:Uncharacterized protein n=1 Tax=Grifola frondosa TaxID=5627 RepID=A0A1C7MFJ7_GRIFR|nr:hypothetical protein A0H81_04455 [Grifola frondosa]
MVLLSEPPGVDSVQLLRLDSHGDELHLSPILVRNVAPTCSTSLCNAAISQNVSSITSSAQTTFTAAAAIPSITPYSRIHTHRPTALIPPRPRNPDITSDFSPSPGVTAASSLFPVLPSLSSVPSSSVLPSTSLPSSSSLASHDHTGAIVGGVIGGCAALVIVIFSAILLADTCATGTQHPPPSSWPLLQPRARPPATATFRSHARRRSRTTSYLLRSHGEATRPRI